MLGWGIAVFLGLTLIFWDLRPSIRTWLLSHPMIVHTIVLGSGLLIHGGSAQGAMAAVVSGIFSAVGVKFGRWCYGYYQRGIFVPGAFNKDDPRLKGAV